MNAAIESLGFGLTGDVSNRIGRIQSAFVYGATCKGLTAYAAETGIPSLHLGLTRDPNLRIAAMNKAQYGSVTRSPDGDHFAWEDGFSNWQLAPLEAAIDGDVQYPMVDGLLKVAVPGGISFEMVVRRFMLLLAPLEAARCSVFPSVVTARPANYPWLGHGQRYVHCHSRFVAIRDIYRQEQMTDILATAAHEAIGAELMRADHAFAISLDLAVNGLDCLGVADALGAP